jgi:hypothetical protein
MTPAEIIAQRIVPFWLPAEETRGDAIADAARAMGRRYRKANGNALTQFNTGAIIVRPDHLLALTECQPARRDGAIELRPPTKARAAVIDDIYRHGPPLLAVLFSKGALDIAAWICCTDDEVVLNGPAGPDETAAMEDVALVRGLKGNVRAWREAAGLYRAARADLSLAPKLYAATDKLAAANGMASDAVLDVVHRLHRVPNLAYALAEPPDARR